jgi:hypothetical protein
MPTKIFLPDCRVMFHPMYPEDGHVWARADAIDSVEKNQAEFKRALQILLENGIKESWLNSSVDIFEMVNHIRIAVGLQELIKEDKKKK